MLEKANSLDKIPVTDVVTAKQAETHSKKKTSHNVGEDLIEKKILLAKKKLEVLKSQSKEKKVDKL